jgi:hypothetical protein
MNNLSENMVFSLITFILISWTISLIFVIHNYNKEMNYLHETIEYQGEVLNTIKIDMKPISQFKGLNQYRTFSCTVGDGQMYYD